MKPNRLKKLTFRLSLCIALVLAAFIIHSCKKESKFTQLSLTDSVNQAKSWYETTYPINTSINSKLTATQSVNTASTSGVDYSQLIKPDWVHAANYKRFNKAVIEMPVDPSAAMAFSLKNKTTGQTVYSKENSKTSFILLNDGKGYAAYIMTILADPSYLRNDHSKLANNTFRKHDADFTGMVFYFTPKGQFVRSYAYKQGKLITPSSATAATQTTQNVNSAKKVAVAAPPTCLDWYWDTWNNGELISEVYLYETCSGGDDPDGGSGSPDPICTTEGINSITSSHLSVNVATPPDGGDDPGYPDPTSSCPAPPTITNNITDSCMKTQVNAALAQGLDSYTSEVANFVFGDNTYFDMNFDQVSTLTPDVDGVTNCQGNPATQSTFTADISLNGNTLPTASKEFIAATVIHETLHAYMTFTGKLNDFNGNQHTQMANNYIYAMQHDLQAMFPNLSDADAQALAWGGLSDTQPWKDMVSNNPVQANNIL